MTTEARYELSDGEIIDRGMRALQKALGYSWVNKIYQSNSRTRHELS